MTTTAALAPPHRPSASPASLMVAGLAILVAVILLLLVPAWVKAPYVASGLGVGVLVGLTGVGGGSLMTPLLILLFGIHPAAAVGTDLLYASATKTVGGGVHAAHDTVDWRLVRRMASGSIPATLLTVAAMRGLHMSGDRSAHFLSVLLGVLLFAAAASILLRNWFARVALARSPQIPENVAAALTVVLGAVLGVLITLTSVGAGALGVTLLVFLYPKLPLSRIVGSDILHAVPLTLIAGTAHWWVGEVNLPLLVSAALRLDPGHHPGQRADAPDLRGMAAADPGGGADAVRVETGQLTRKDRLRRLAAHRDVGLRQAPLKPLLALVRLLLILGPRAVRPPTSTVAIRVMIRAYSIAVAPRSSRAKRLSSDMADSSRTPVYQAGLKSRLSLKVNGIVEGMARVTGLEPATSGVTGRRSNQLSYTRVPGPGPAARWGQ